ncbi:MAG: X-Pro dipeptidyl-peptidase family [Hyphomicrobiales bacterium]|nr:X-Pro dipeptidyl-peptidase family [Hyphomicrobiales bacterium]
MRTRDGVRLDADVYRPRAPGDYPVLLMRQAYGRRIACTICYAHPSWYAAHGYLVVVQDVRGRGTSEGEFRCGEHEAADGADAVAWAAGLPGSDGCVGMYGFSYQGYVQLFAAAAAGPQLKSIAPAMFPWDARRHWAYENGAFRLGGALGWAIQIAAETARRNGDPQAFAELAAASNALPIHEAVTCRPALMERHAALSHYQDWLDQPEGSDYWRRVSPCAHVDAIRARDLPTLIVGGWWDYMLRGTLAGHRALAPGASNVRLVVGPWLHFPWDRRAAGVDFGPEAGGGLDDLHIRWFDQTLKGRQTGVLEESPVRLFDVGAKTWRGFSHWPSGPVSLALSGDGRASIDASAGALRWPEQPAQAAVERIVHDPWRPAPGVGGAFGAPAGPVDRAMVDTRGDVLTFTSAPVTEPLTLAGDVALEVEAGSDAAGFDLSCVLSRVTASGQAIPCAEGYAAIADAVVRIPMRACCVTLQPGEALRLSLAGAFYPAFAVNPGDGQNPTRASRERARIVTIAIAVGADARTRLSINLLVPEG